MHLLPEINSSLSFDRTKVFILNSPFLVVVNVQMHFYVQTLALTVRNKILLLKDIK